MRRRVQAVRRCAAVLGLLLVSAAPAFAGDPTWVWPLEGPRTVSRPFAPPATRYGAGHRGADLPGVVGAVVRAAGAGRVSYAGLLAGRGVVVVVHGDLRTTYEPVTAAVHVGQQVRAGQPIGRLAPGGHCGAGCLHWGLLRGDVYLDPVQLVHRGPSRLLPVEGSGVAPGTGAAARTGPAAVARPAPLPTPSAVPPVEPAFALRSADGALGTAALVALVAGLALLLRPRRPPDGPAAPAATVVLPRPTTAVVRAEAAPTGLVDLTAERNRRRPEVA